MKVSMLVLLLATGCSYKYVTADPDLANRVSSLEARSSENAAAVSSAEARRR